MPKKDFFSDLYMEEIREKIKTMSKPNNVTGCWEWQGAKLHSGYGHLRFRGSDTTAHRVSYIVFICELDQGIIVRHQCHNKACVNPEHLEIGTQAENIQDTIKAGRFNKPRGSANHNAKLTEEDVMYIRDEWEKENGITTKTLFCEIIAEDFNVKPGTIQDVINRKNWRHLN